MSVYPKAVACNLRVEKWKNPFLLFDRAYPANLQIWPVWEFHLISTERPNLAEVKGSGLITKTDCRNLASLSEEMGLFYFLFVCVDVIFIVMDAVLSSEHGTQPSSLTATKLSKHPWVVCPFSK